MHEKSHIAMAFNRAAFHYNEYASLQYTIGKNLIDSCERHNEENVLDLGSGTGHLNTFLHEKFSPKDIISLDIAFNMLKISENNNFKLCADFDAIPFSNNSFSTVFSNMALQWSMDLSITLQEIRRILKPQGKLIFSTLGASSFKELRTSWEIVDTFPHCNTFLSENELHHILEKAGFSFTLKKEIKVLYFSTFLELCLHIKNYGGNRVFARNKQVYSPSAFKKVEKAYEVFFTSDNLLPLTYEVFYVIAE